MKYCDSDTCDSEAVETVRVSVDKAHDSRRHLCQQCYQMYLIGVQHGRFHEAAVLKTVPSRGSSQLKPHTKAWRKHQEPYVESLEERVNRKIQESADFLKSMMKGAHGKRQSHQDQPQGDEAPAAGG